jgi:hypothetical protein
VGLTAGATAALAEQDVRCAKADRFAGGFWHTLGQMRMNEITPEQFSLVPCPTCGVGPGKRCLQHTGELRKEAHIDRKLSAAEAIEMKQLPRRAR